MLFIYVGLPFILFIIYTYSKNKDKKVNLAETIEYLKYNKRILIEKQIANKYGRKTIKQEKNKEKIINKIEELEQKR